MLAKPLNQRLMLLLLLLFLTISALWLTDIFTYFPPHFLEFLPIPRGFWIAIGLLLVSWLMKD